jgi:hypothetical protein
MISLFGQVQVWPLDDGQVRLQPSGVIELAWGEAPELKLGLQLWHGEWVYVHQASAQATPLSQSEAGLTLQGDMTDAQGTKALHFQETVAAKPGAIVVTYQLTKPAGVKLCRPPSLELRVPLAHYQGRRQLVVPGVVARLPAFASAAGQAYWLEVADGKGLVMDFSQPSDFELRAEGDSYLVRATVAPPDFRTAELTVSLEVRALPRPLPGEVSGDRRPLGIRQVAPARAEVPRPPTRTPSIPTRLPWMPISWHPPGGSWWCRAFT